MRRRTVVAAAALIAAVALAGLPDPAGSRSPSTSPALGPVAYSTVTIPASAPTDPVPGVIDAVPQQAVRATSEAGFVELGVAPDGPTSRPTVDQPSAPSGQAWKAPRYKISGYASFYDNGTTAMRLPRGTVVRICGAGGCIQRTVTDYGPVSKIRVVDMYRPDFFKICGCASWSGTTKVTVSVY
jgi:hypothetical protein